MNNHDNDKRPYEKLMAAIINRAVLDMCIKPRGRKFTHRVVASGEGTSSIRAIEFIFKNGTMAKVYLELLGIDIEIFRERLLKTMYAPQSLGDKKILTKEISEGHKRAFRFNYNQYQIEEAKTAALKAEMEKWRKRA